MQLKNAFTVPCDPQAAWRLLLDVPAITPCLPGAELTEVIGDNSYKGRAKVKVGPVLLTFAGTAEIVEIDEQARKALVRARGADEKGRGSAQANVTFVVNDDAEGARVDVITDLNLVGAVAQYGRASGLMQGIATEITKEFASNLEALLRAGEPASAAATSQGTALSTAPAPAAAKPVGGIGLLWRGIRSMIAGWIEAIMSRFGRSKN